MSAAAHLPLYEEIVLLALDVDKGNTALGDMFATAMGGAMLAELAMLGAARLDKDKQKSVTVVKGIRVDDSLLAECLDSIATHKNAKNAAHWVRKFSGLKDLKNRAARQLVDKGVLKEDADKVLGIFPRTIFPESDPGPEKELRDRLYWAIFTSAGEVEARTVVATSLLQATGMLPRVFDKKKLKGRKQRLEKLTGGEVVGQAAKEAVEAVQAAIFVTTIMPAVFVATT